MKKKRIPSSNNAGAKRERLTVEQIINHPKFLFNSDIVKRCFRKDGYKTFVEKYLAKSHKGAKAPSSAQLEVFNLLKKKKITLEEAKNRLGNPKTFYQKLGRLYAYTAN